MGKKKTHPKDLPKNKQVEQNFEAIARVLITVSVLLQFFIRSYNIKHRSGEKHPTSSPGHSKSVQICLLTIFQARGDLSMGSKSSILLETGEALNSDWVA